MKRIVVIATGLLLALGAPVGAVVLRPHGSFKQTANDSVAIRAGSELSPAPKVALGSGPLVAETNKLEATDSLASLSGNNSEGISVYEPVASSGPTAAVPMPRAAWIGLAGVLGVIVTRWISLRRTHARSAAND